MGYANIEAEIVELEKQVSETKYNKKTQFAIGLVKAKIAKLKEKQEHNATKKSHTQAFAVKKTGDATVVLVGFPSVGKSTILNLITNAASKVAAYAFTTLKPIPGVMNYNDAEIQVVDVPGIIYGAASGKGRGKEVISIMRGADLLLIVLDIFNLNHYDALMQEIYDANIRVNKRKPKVVIAKKSRGGLTISSVVKQMVDMETFRGVAKELGFLNADIIIYDEIDVDEFIDCLEGNRVYTNSMCVINKYDNYGYLNGEQRIAFDDFVKKHNPLLISAQTKYHVEELRQKIFENLHLIRVYTKDKAKGVDLTDPVILKKGSTIKSVGEKLHHDFIKKVKFVKVWGKSAKFDGQVFRNLDHVMADKDIIEFFLR